MGKTWFHVISEEIEKRIADLQEFLGGRGAKNFEQYCEICGQIKGLRATQTYIEELGRAYAEEQDND